jgi:hypothetical protein
LNNILRIVSDWKNRWLGRLQFSISDLKQYVTWTQAGDMRGAAFVNILEHPALIAIEVAPHECGGNSMAAGNVRTLGMPKPCVTGF